MQRPAPRLYANLAGVEIGDGLPVRVIGVVNVSPESFYPASVAGDPKALLDTAERMVAEGADILDVGAVSTAPYLRGSIDIEEELSRVVGALRALRGKVAVPLSIDTQRSEVARAALAEGANIINDVSGLYSDPAMAVVAREAEGVILMALERGPSDGDPLVTAGSLLRQSLRRARAGGIDLQRIVLDPGIGFFRRAPQAWHEVDCQVLKHLARLRRLGRPLMIGVSRKSFLGKLTGKESADDRLPGSIAAAAIAVFNGAAMVRAHDVAATVDAVRVAEAIRTS